MAVKRLMGYKATKMVTTRQSTANGAPTNEISKPNFSDTTNNTIHFLKSSSSKTHTAPTTLKLSSTAVEPAHLGSISEHDLSLTSPPARKGSEKVTMSTSSRNQDNPSQIDRITSSSPLKLATKPTNAIGGSLNPIIVMDSPSPVRLAQAPKRRQQQQSEPHRFIDRGYRKLYSYRPSRPALAPKPANGSTFTGHQSHDIYRMMNAKMAARWRDSGATAYGVPGYYNVPFEVQYPMSAQYLAQHSRPVYQQQSPSNKYHSHDAPQLNGYSPVAVESEKMLRKRALQYVREYSRPSPRKRRLSDADLDETSTSESEPYTSVSRSSLVNSTPRPSLLPSSSPFAPPKRPDNTKFTILHTQDPNFDITQLTEHTSLLTSLLQAYPYSPDQKGLREDIAMLVSVQNQRVREWMKIESQIARKRRKSNTNSSMSAINHSDGSMDPAMMPTVNAQQHLEQKKKKEHDDEMRRFFSAKANMWQDGSGQGVADVFADGAGSSVAASFDGKTSSPGRSISGFGGEVPRSESMNEALYGKLASAKGKVTDHNSRAPNPAGL